jgi:hypothetical protein
MSRNLRSLQELPSEIAFAKTAEFLTPREQSALRATCKIAADMIPSTVDVHLNNPRSALNFFCSILKTVPDYSDRKEFLPRDLSTVQVLCHLLTVAYYGFVFVPKGRAESVDIRDVMFLRTWHRPSAEMTSIWHHMRFRIPVITMFWADEHARQYLSSLQAMYPPGHPLIHDGVTTQSVRHPAFDPANREAISRAGVVSSFHQMLQGKLNTREIPRTPPLEFLLLPTLDVPIRSTCPVSFFDLIEVFQQPVFTLPWPTPCPQKPRTVTEFNVSYRFLPSRPGYKLVGRYMNSVRASHQVEGVEFFLMKNTVPPPIKSILTRVNREHFLVFADENPWLVLCRPTVHSSLEQAECNTFFHACMFIFEIPPN